MTRESIFLWRGPSVGLIYPRELGPGAVRHPFQEVLSPRWSPVSPLRFRITGTGLSNIPDPSRFSVLLLLSSFSYWPIMFFLFEYFSVSQNFQVLSEPPSDYWFFSPFPGTGPPFFRSLRPFGHTSLTFASGTIPQAANTRLWCSCLLVSLPSFYPKISLDFF